MDLERAPRSELLKTIEKQRELLQRRESKLRDVVTAYKGLVKEKEALESSMKVLSAAQARNKRLEVPHSKGPPSDSASDRGQESDRESEDGGGGGHQFIDPLNLSNSVQEEELAELQTQVDTLSSSLLTMTEEKSKLEVSYIAEKKLLKQENEELHRQVDKQKQRAEALQHDLQNQLTELKGWVRGQQIEREKEQTDHAVMLRELQRLLANERQAKEQIEHQYDEATFNLKEKDNLLPELTGRHEKQVVALSHQIEGLEGQLRTMREKSQKPSPILISLQREAAELKAQHRLQVQQDLYHVQDAEAKVKVASHQSESRISELETKLSELAESVGNYERLRFQDQQTILRLKDRVSQLDMENSSLARVRHGDEDDENLDTMDVQTLVDKIVKLKSHLKLINEQSERPVNIEELLMEHSTEMEPPLVRKYREELEQVRDEFERYRLRAQSVLKNKKEQSTVSREEDHLKEVVGELREKMRTMHMHQEEEMEHNRQREDHLRHSLLSLQEKHKHEVTQMQGEHHTQLQEFEDELKKQRDRTISMLAEKDREVEQLRLSSLRGQDADYMRYRSTNMDMGGASSERQTTEDDAVRRLLAAPPTGQSEVTLLYFAQEQARKDVDITTLRKQKRELEVALRELQMSAGMKQEQLNEEIDRLKEEIRKLERNITREDANLEYLKNVTYKFLICSDAHGKQQMLNAITTILQFSPREKSSVQAHSKGWWPT